MQRNNGRSGMPSSSNSSGKKMKVAGSNYESNSNDIQFGANILNNASSCMFPDRFSPPNNAMIAPYSPPNFVNRLHQPQHRVNADDGNYIDPYLRTFPPGFRFYPKDEELVVYYLMKKIRNEPLPKNRIHEVNIYDYHPKTLAEKYKLFQEDAWYFFTTRLKKYPKGKIPDRGVPGGFWKPTGSPVTVPATHSNIAIERRSLDFYEGKGNTGRRTEWKMHEYYPKTDDNVSSTNTEGMRLNDCVLCRIYLKGGKQQAEAKTTCNNKSRNDGNSVSHGSADSRNDDHTSSDNINSQQPANHGASASDTIEVYDGTQAFYDYSMDQRYYADSSNQILASMDPAMFAFPDAIEGTSRGFSQSVAFAGPSSSTPLTMNVAGMINGPSSSMPLTMNVAGMINGPSSSTPLTMNVAGMINGPSFPMPLTMHGPGLNGATSSLAPLTMHVAAGLNGATSSMHGAGLNGPNSSKPPTTLPGNTMDADDHLVEPDSLPDDFFNDDSIARIIEMFQQ
ncbi:hypothetical protein OIU76_021282 [Salix suchowensis]|nr:hypothetical protein OIU76_021282 [Salix suchowensis]